MNQTSQAKSFSEPVNFLGAQSLLKSPSLYCIAIVPRSIWKRRTTFIKKERRNVENTRLWLVFSTFHGCSQKTLCRKHLPAARVFYISWVFSNVGSVLSQSNTRLRLLHSRNVENTPLRLVFSTFPSSSQMPVMFYHSVIHGLGFLKEA